MLTGKYPHHCVPGHEYRLPPDQQTIAHAFKENGYITAYVGKWHLDGFHEREGRAAFHIVPPERRGGFDYWMGYENNNSQYDCRVSGGWGQETEQIRLDGYETDALTDLFLQRLEEFSQQDRPFFAVLSVQPPHDPYIAPPDYMKNYNPASIQMRRNVPDILRIQDKARRDLAGAYAMIENLDYNVGRIVQALRENRLYEDTHILFFSDHGDMHGSHGQYKKTSPYEESMRIPFIIGGEQAFYGRKTGISDILINHVDIAPTTLGLCGIKKPAGMEGTDYASRRLPSAPPDREPDSAYLQVVVPTGHGNSVDKPWRAVVTAEGWKYACFESMPWLLFNLREDPYEQANHAHNLAYREKLKELNGRAIQWARETGDTFLFPEL